ncbi:hypothetical protein Nmel_011234 [Mimus melanotis]
MEVKVPKVGVNTQMEGQSQQLKHNCTAAICQPLWKQQHREEELLPYPVHLFDPVRFCSTFRLSR